MILKNMKVSEIVSEKVEVIELPCLMVDKKDGEVYLVLKKKENFNFDAIVLKVGKNRPIDIVIGSLIEDLNGSRLTLYKDKIILEN